MRLWRRASGALKDRNSIVVASLVRRTALRNPDVEAAVIRATSHDDSRVDYRNAQRVFVWIRMSPTYLKPFVWALCMRMEKTRNWVVAIKGLILIHGVFCCRVPAVQKIGRLPFDLSNFEDGYLSMAKAWGFNAFIRVYYAFLDQKSAYMCMDLQERKVRNNERNIAQDLVRLQRMQALLDMLLDIKPQDKGAITALILEAMDCVIIEIYDTYSRICDGIAKALVKIYLADKAEALVALKILQKSAVQGKELSEYFEFCKGIGVLNAAECPKVQQVPEEDIRELERIINGDANEKVENREQDKTIIIIVDEARVAEEQKDLKRKLETIITNKWEVFDEDLMKVNGDHDFDGQRITKKQNPFDGPLIPIVHPYGNQQELPDLISF